MPVAIYDGEINGSSITFKCQDPGHDRTITFTGIVNGDEMIFTRTVVIRPGGDPGRNGIFGASGTAEFTAQRVVPSGVVPSGVVPSGAASASAKPDQGNDASPPPAAEKPESGVTGVWAAHDVGFAPWMLTLKADGVKLSGTVQQGARGSSGYTTLTMPVTIYDGEIDGNKIIFKCQDPGHDRTITFTGIVNGDAITFTRTVLVKPGGRPGSNGIFGASGAAEFTAQRVVPSGAASAPAKLGSGVVTIIHGGRLLRQQRSFP